MKIPSMLRTLGGTFRLIWTLERNAVTRKRALRTTGIRMSLFPKVQEGMGQREEETTWRAINITIIERKKEGAQLETGRRQEQEVMVTLQMMMETIQIRREIGGTEDREGRFHLGVEEPLHGIEEGGTGRGHHQIRHRRTLDRGAELQAVATGVQIITFPISRREPRTGC
jgi:hypothetical protein